MRTMEHHFCSFEVKKRKVLKPEAHFDSLMDSEGWIFLLYGKVLQSTLSWIRSDLCVNKLNLIGTFFQVVLLLWIMFRLLSFI